MASQGPHWRKVTLDWVQSTSVQPPSENQGLVPHDDPRPFRGVLESGKRRSNPLALRWNLLTPMLARPRDGQGLNLSKQPSRKAGREPPTQPALPTDATLACPWSRQSHRLRPGRAGRHAPWQNSHKYYRCCGTGSATKLSGAGKRRYPSVSFPGVPIPNKPGRGESPPDWPAASGPPSQPDSSSRPRLGPWTRVSRPASIMSGFPREYLSGSDRMSRRLPGLPRTDGRVLLYLEV
jgi:hypothetical protein